MALEGGQFHPAQYGNPVLAEPMVRTSLFHGSGASTRLLLSFTLPMQRKLAFWRLRVRMETILELKSPMGVNDFFLCRAQCARSVCTSEVCTSQVLVIFYQTLGVMLSVFQQYSAALLTPL